MNINFYFYLLYFQIIIKQLKDKLENTKAEIETKNSDITTHNDEFENIKTELKDLIETCEQLYEDYDAKRIQVSFYGNCWIFDLTNQWINFAGPRTQK
jgi:hypothetical protein